MKNKLKLLPHPYLVHGEVGEQDDNVVLHSDNQPRVPLVTTSDDLDVVAHLEALAQLTGRELQRVLKMAQIPDSLRTHQLITIIITALLEYSIVRSIV